MLELKNISKQFGQHKIFDNYNLTVEEGKILAIVGPSGGGKTTLLRMLAGLETIDSGQIIYENEEIPLDQMESRNLLGFVFQDFQLFPHLTVLDNLTLSPIKTMGMSKEDAQKKAQTLLDRLGLGAHGNAYPYSLSGGQKQRVAIARALANDPEILISDEGTSALDPKTTNQILDLLKSLHEKLGITVVLITHEMQVVKEIANKVAVMQNGEIIEQNSLIDIFAQPKEALTKQFIETTSSVNRFIASLSRTELLAQLADDEELIHLDYSGSELEDPVVSDITKKFDVTTNIFYGNVELLQGQPFGSLVLTLKGSSEHRAAAKAYFVERHLKFEVLGKIERTVD